MRIKYVLRKTSKKQILIDALQNYIKISFKRLYTNLSYLFFHEFLRHIFQIDPYANFKKFLAYFCIIKTI